MEINDFYSELLIEYANDPVYQGIINAPDFHQELLNPLCGDRISICGTIVNHKIDTIKFQGQGCAISKASSAILCSLNKNCELAKSEKLIELFERMIFGKDLSEDEWMLLGDAKILAGVAKIPGRQRCALLAWENLKKALAERQ